MSAKAHLAAVLSFTCLCLFIHAKEAQPLRESRLLLISDIHFDPTADPALVNRLIAAPPERWAAIFSQSNSSKLSAYHTDTNWPLFSSALAGMKSVMPEPPLIIITGDFLAHNLKDKFTAAASPDQRTDANFRIFAKNIVAFIALQLKQSFPAATILPALGNNDSDAVHYELDPSGSFLQGTAATVADLTGHPGDKDIQADWSSLGSYSTVSPSLPGHRLISLNTVFFSAKYLRENGEEDTAAGMQVLYWLEGQLKSAKAAGQKVWLTYHIPPGIDAFATSRTGPPKDAQSCRHGIVTMWRQSFETRFEKVMAAYAPEIEASFAGHTHRESFMLLGSASKPSGFVLIAPSIGPSSDNNPGFRTISFSPGGQLNDASTYYLDLANAGASWKDEYDFNAIWKAKQLNLESLTELNKRLAGANSEERSRWMAQYSVQAQPRPGTSPSLAQALYCSVEILHRMLLPAVIAGKEPSFWQILPLLSSRMHERYGSGWKENKPRNSGGIAAANRGSLGGKTSSFAGGGVGWR